MRLMGTVRDMNRRKTQQREDTEPVQYDINKTRSWIFEDGLGPNSTLINKVLSSCSLLPLRVSPRCPTNNFRSWILFQSAFSTFSASLPKPLQFNHHRLYKPDVMHEIEAGFWKRVLIHLLRILLFLKSLVRFNRR